MKQGALLIACPAWARRLKEWMTRTRWLIAAFWLFVGCGLLWQCSSGHLQLLPEAPPTRDPGTQYQFTPPPPQPHPDLPSVPTDAPQVKQTAFVVHPSTPGQGSFTCEVTLRNDGTQTAHGVQIHVRPYRGVRVGNDSLGGHLRYHQIDEGDSVSQYGEWLTFPDLAPGQSATQSAVFYDHPNVLPGYNPNPDITFAAKP